MGEVVPVVTRVLHAIKMSGFGFKSLTVRDDASLWTRSLSFLGGEIWSNGHVLK